MTTHEVIDRLSLGATYRDVRSAIYEAATHDPELDTETLYETVDEYRAQHDFMPRPALTLEQRVMELEGFVARLKNAVR